MRVSLTGTNSTFTQSGVSLWKPDGTYFAWFFDDWGPGTWFGGPHTLPTTGTYAILVDPAAAYTGSLTLSLYDVPPDATGSMTVGPAVAVSIATPGQNASLAFEATAGQPITIRGANSTIGCLSMFLAGGQAALKSRLADERDDEIQRLRAKVGEITMNNELLLDRCHRLEGGLPLALRRRSE